MTKRAKVARPVKAWAGLGALTNKIEMISFWPQNLWHNKRVPVIIADARHYRVVRRTRRGKGAR
jgi:hypothetical protein